MARMITKQASGTTIASGKIKALNDDGSMILETTVSNRVPILNKDGSVAKGKDGREMQRTEWVPKDLKVTNQLGFSSDDYRVGNMATAIGEYSVRSDTLTADAVISRTAGSYSYNYKNSQGADMELQVLAGFVSFANYNEEINKETGEHYKNQSGENRKPHFDVCVRVKDEATGQYVSHIVKYYNTKNAPKNIEACKKAFENYDKEKNSAFVTMIVGAGREYTRQRTTDGGETSYVCSEHLGNNVPDVSIVDFVMNRSRSQQNTQPAQQAAPSAAQGSGMEQQIPDEMEYDMEEFQ